MSVIAIVIVVAFVYVASTVVALLAAFIRDDGTKRRYLFAPVLNLSWAGWSVVRTLAAQRHGPSPHAPTPEIELARRDAINSALKPPYP